MQGLQISILQYEANPIHLDIVTAQFHQKWVGGTRQLVCNHEGWPQLLDESIQKLIWYNLNETK